MAEREAKNISFVFALNCSWHGRGKSKTARAVFVRLFNQLRPYFAVFLVCMDYFGENF